MPFRINSLESAFAIKRGLVRHMSIEIAIYRCMYINHTIYYDVVQKKTSKVCKYFIVKENQSSLCRHYVFRSMETIYVKEEK